MLTSFEFYLFSWHLIYRRFFWFIFAKKFCMFSALVRALMWDVRHFKYIWSQHLKVQFHIRSVSDKEITGYMLKINLRELWRRIATLSLWHCCSWLVGKIDKGLEVFPIILRHHSRNLFVLLRKP